MDGFTLETDVVCVTGSEKDTGVNSAQLGPCTHERARTHTTTISPVLDRTASYHPLTGLPLPSRLSCCNRWHPKEESDVYIVSERSRKGKPVYYRMECRRCRSERKKVQTTSTASSTSYKEDGKYRAMRATPYGVLPACSWPDPFTRYRTGTI